MRSSVPSRLVVAGLAAAVGLVAVGSRPGAGTRMILRLRRDPEGASRG